MPTTYTRLPSSATSSVTVRGRSGRSRRLFSFISSSRLKASTSAAGTARPRSGTLPALAAWTPGHRVGHGRTRGSLPASSRWSSLTVTCGQAPSQAPPWGKGPRGPWGALRPPPPESPGCEGPGTGKLCGAWRLQGGSETPTFQPEQGLLLQSPSPHLSSGVPPVPHGQPGPLAQLEPPSLSPAQRSDLGSTHTGSAGLREVPWAPPPESLRSRRAPCQPGRKGGVELGAPTRDLGSCSISSQDAGGL